MSPAYSTHLTDLQYDVNLAINLTTNFPLKSCAFLSKKGRNLVSFNNSLSRGRPG